LANSREKKGGRGGKRRRESTREEGSSTLKDAMTKPRFIFRESLLGKEGGVEWEEGKM